MCEVKHKAMLEDEFIAVAPNNILGNSVIAPMFFRRWIADGPDVATHSPSFPGYFEV